MIAFLQHDKSNLATPLSDALLDACCLALLDSNSVIVIISAR